MFHSFDSFVYLFANILYSMKNNVQFSSENTMMQCILKEMECLLLLLLSLNRPHFPHCAFSTIRTFYTPHFPPNPESAIA